MIYFLYIGFQIYTVYIYVFRLYTVYIYMSTFGGGHLGGGVR